MRKLIEQYLMGSWNASLQIMPLRCQAFLLLPTLLVQTAFPVAVLPLPGLCPCRMLLLLLMLMLLRRRPVLLPSQALPLLI